MKETCPALGASVPMENSPFLHRHCSTMCGDGQETLFEQRVPVKNYAILGADRDVHSQFCLNGCNS